MHTATIDIVRRSGLYHRLEQTFEFLGASVTGRLSRKKLYTTENQISKSVLLLKTKYSVYCLQLALWTTKKHNFNTKKGYSQVKLKFPDSWKQQQMGVCYLKLFRYTHFLYFPGTLLLFDLIYLSKSYYCIINAKHIPCQTHTVFIRISAQPRISAHLE